MYSTINKRVQAIAPSGKINKELFLSGKLFLEKYFTEIIFNDFIFSRFRNMAGKDQLRSEELIYAISNEENDIVWAIRGGFGSSRSLPLLNEIKTDLSNKLLIGYSDITAYQLFFYEKYKMKSISGAMIQVDFPTDVTSKHFTWMYSLIKNDYSEFTYPKNILFKNFIPLNGIILGGCLSIISKTLGTPYSVTFSNKILFLEDVSEPIYRLDGYFSHLKNAGVFYDIQGIILGQFTAPETSNTKNYKKELLELFDEYFFSENIPAIYNFPIGHILGTFPLPIGFNAEISKDKLVFRK